MILTILDSTGTTQGPNERRRYLQIGLLALALLLVGVLGFRQVQRWMTPQKDVWVAAADLPTGATLGSTNLKRVKMAESALPKGAMTDARALAGRELARPKQEGDPFTRADLAASETEAAAIAELVPEGRVLTTIRVPKTLVPYKNLKSGDRVDVVAIDRGGRGGFARVIARDAYIIGTMFASSSPQESAPRTGLAALVPPPQTPRGPSTIGLILGLHPEDAIPLAKATGTGETIQVVLHGKTEVASGELLELPVQRPVEYIVGAKKSRLSVVP
ncbi:MAG TPA: SAF domain-containing protein [Thermoanaerobaculia bacterium]|jgi:Flp pilus assembly protein CpaB